MNSPNKSGKSWEVGEEPPGAVLNAVGCVGFLPRPADCQFLRCQGLNGSEVENFTSKQKNKQNLLKNKNKNQIKKQANCETDLGIHGSGGPGSLSAPMPALDVRALGT